MKKLLIIGSIAFDCLMRYEGVFQEKILPEHLKSLSVSFAVKGRKIMLGGCGGNIAFHHKKSGGNPLLFGLAGKDFWEYEDWLKQNDIDTKNIIQKKDEDTSAAFVLSDKKGHQIAIFDEGAAKEFSEKDSKKLGETVRKEKENIGAAIIAPTQDSLMRQAAFLCVENGIPYIFDPGQSVIRFSPEELRELSSRAYGIFTNEYEMKLLMKETGFSREKIETVAPLCVETLGEKGSIVSFRGERFFTEPAPVEKIIDPTGCGDAYRGAFLAELLKKDFFDLTQQRKQEENERIIKRAATSGSSRASYVLQISGTQG